MNEARNEAFDLNAEFKKAKDDVDMTQPDMSFSTSKEESLKGKVDEGDEDEDTKAHPSSSCPQDDPSQAASSPTQVASPGSRNIIPGQWSLSWFAFPL